MPPLTSASPASRDRAGAAGPDRRDALKLLASGMALALASCGRPFEEIVPYVDMPERLVPGEPLRFATALPLAGYGRGVLATSIDGRPIKIEGNPRHPASLGATDVFAESAILSLYDPDRSKTVRGPEGISSWDAFVAALTAQMRLEGTRGGAGLRLLTGRVTSPTLLRQLGALLERYPQARWYRAEPVDDDAARAGAVQAFARALVPRPRLSDATVVLALDADPLGPGPDQVRLARDYAARRHAGRGGADLVRLYAVEPTLSLTGANADHRLALAPQRIEAFTAAVAAALGAAVPAGLPADLPPSASHFAAAVAADLEAHASHAVVLAGPAQPARVHALCHWINARISAPVDLIAPVDPSTQGHGEALAAFAEDCASGRAGTALILDANPAYHAPGDLAIADALRKVGFSAHLGPYADETAALVRWHLPLSHPLESWSDLAAPDGTAAVVQPLIRPLYDTRTAHDVVALAGGALSPSAYDLVRETWRAAAKTADFEAWWRQVLHDGVIPATAHAPVAAGAPALANAASSSAAPDGRLTLTFAPDPSVWDGGFANNAWLQECPKPVTKQVWGNTLLVSRADAARLALADGDVVRLTRGPRAVEAPVAIDAGQADGTISATLGYGRRAGTIARDIGFDLFALRPRDMAWRSGDVALARTGRRRDMLTTQHHFRLDGEAADLLRTLAVGELARHDGFVWPQDSAPPSLNPGDPFAAKPETRPEDHADAHADTHAWAMVIDTALCIGCNACVVACQAENNVPVVGPDEIARGRDMHWLRVDTYRAQGAPTPAGFEPVPCMHCEHAPCEPVCPVAASVHDREGLNVQVYNRCIGTRFCQSNCPYKVRRFNFFGYSDGEEYADLGAESMKAQKNPEVTVRARGVMEKCTYCVQRISRARRNAEKEDRPIGDGEVVTACQAACPTRAIAFGDLASPSAQVNALRRDRRHYALLGHLGTRPRTTYLARLANPNPALAEPQS